MTEPSPPRDAETTTESGKAHATRGWRRVALAIPRSGRLQQVGLNERWGYAVWSYVLLVVAIPEFWPARPPWPRISDAIAHLDRPWKPILVVLLAAIASGGNEPTGLTVEGHQTIRSRPAARITPAAYLWPATIGVFLPTILVSKFGSSAWAEAYVLYGSLAVFAVILPGVLAYWFGKEVPFPTFARTVANLESRFYFVSKIFNGLGSFVRRG
jgi:hypothetical protein